jgi:membrane dipeptidase
MARRLAFALLWSGVLLAGAGTEAAVQARAEALAQRLLLVDTHIDYPDQHKVGEDPSVRTSGNFDLPRARKGGLKAAFMAVYISPEDDQKGLARATAEARISLVESMARRWPELCTLARTPAEVRQNTAEGRISLPMGMENGAPLAGELAAVARYHARGIAYITLAHMKSNHVCDSSTDAPRWHGLSPFGREVVAEMNRQGVMIDVSHISDEAFEQVLALSRAPVIASHSACRAFLSPGTFGYKRGLSDAMIQAVARRGGVVQVPFGSAFLSDRYGREKKVADVRDVAAHIDHAVKLAGVDHVGIGSDFDGVGRSVPTGLEDVSCYPNLIRELLKLGYSEPDLRKLVGENLLRVWAEVLRLAE